MRATGYRTAVYPHACPVGWIFKSPQPSKRNMMPEIISPLFPLQAEDRL